MTYMIPVCYTNQVNQGITHSGSDLFALYPIQRAPLHLAAGKGDDDILLRLAASGADVNIIDNNGVSK